MPISGEYLELDRPRRLRFTWDCSTWEEGESSVVTVDLMAHGHAGTLMTIHHAQLPPPLADGHRRGWDRIGTQLEGHLRDRLPDPRPGAVRG